MSKRKNTTQSGSETSQNSFETPENLTTTTAVLEQEKSRSSVNANVYINPDINVNIGEEVSSEFNKIDEQRETEELKELVILKTQTLSEKEWMERKPSKKFKTKTTTTSDPENRPKSMIGSFDRHVYAAKERERKSSPVGATQQLQDEYLGAGPVKQVFDPMQIHHANQPKDRIILNLPQMSHLRQKDNQFLDIDNIPIEISNIRDINGQKVSVEEEKMIIEQLPALVRKQLKEAIQTQESKLEAVQSRIKNPNYEITKAQREKYTALLDPQNRRNYQIPDEELYKFITATNEAQRKIDTALNELDKKTVQGKLESLGAELLELVISPTFKQEQLIEWINLVTKWHKDVGEKIWELEFLDARGKKTDLLNGVFDRDLDEVYKKFSTEIQFATIISKRGYNPLHRALYFKSPKIFDEVLKHPLIHFWINQPNVHEQTPLALFNNIEFTHMQSKLAEKFMKGLEAHSACKNGLSFEQYGQLGGVFGKLIMIYEYAKKEPDNMEMATYIDQLKIETKLSDQQKIVMLNTLVCEISRINKEERIVDNSVKTSVFDYLVGMPKVVIEALKVSFASAPTITVSDPKSEKMEVEEKVRQ